MAQPNYQSSTDARSADLQDKVQQFKTKAEETASNLADEGAKVLKQAETAAVDAYASTKRFVQEQPLLAIGITATAALALGALWKLSQSNRRDDLYSRIADSVEPQYRALRRKF